MRLGGGGTTARQSQPRVWEDSTQVQVLHTPGKEPCIAEQVL